MNNTKIMFRGSFAPVMSAIRIGPEITRLTIDVPKSEQFNAVGLQALLETPLIFTVVPDNSPASTRIERPENGDKPAKPKKEPPHPHGEYWRRLHLWPIWTDPNLLEVLDCPADAEHVWESLHEHLKTSSCALISPAEFELWLTEHALDGLVTVSRQVQARMKGAQV